MDGPDGPDGLVVTGDVTLPGSALRWRFSRSSGPGGQGVDTTDSRVELSVDLGSCPGLPDAARERLKERLARRLHDDVLTVVASEHRAQRRNRDAARLRLAALLRSALAPDPPTRRARTPSRRAAARRLEAKRAHSDLKRGRRRPDARGGD